MNISTVARQTGVPAKTIRYYESIGLIPPAQRSGNGYRTYTEADVETLRFVQRARGLGFPVRDVGNLLALWRDRSRASRDVKVLAQEHLRDIERRIRELESMHATLQGLVQCCQGDDRPDCPILQDLAGGVDATPELG